MKCAYILSYDFGREDVESIRLAQERFGHVCAGFSLPVGKFGADYAESVSALRRGIGNIGGVSIDFFNNGLLDNFLRSIGAEFLVVSKNRGILPTTRFPIQFV